MAHATEKMNRGPCRVGRKISIGIGWKFIVAWLCRSARPWIAIGEHHQGFEADLKGGVDHCIIGAEIEVAAAGLDVSPTHVEADLLDPAGLQHGSLAGA